MSSTKKGFTLVELLIVVLIIGLLTGGILLAVVKAQQRGRDAQRINDINSVASALTAYYADKHHYPDPRTTPCPTTFTPGYINTCSEVGAVAYAWLNPALVTASPSYLQSVPKPVSLSYLYQYSAVPPASYTEYDLKTSLELNRLQPNGSNLPGYEIKNGEVVNYTP